MTDQIKWIRWNKHKWAGRPFLSAQDVLSGLWNRVHFDHIISVNGIINIKALSSKKEIPTFKWE